MADGPLLHWRLGDTPGAATAEDASPNNRDGAYVGTPGYHTGGGPAELAPGVTLSGDDYVDRASEAATNFERTDAFTVEAWFRHGAVASPGAESLVEKMLGGPSFRGYGLAMVGTAEPTNAGRLRFHLINQNDTGNRIFVRTNHRFDDSQWHHVVATYDGSSTAAGVRIYVDGTLAATTVEVNALSATTQSGARLRAGSRTGAGDAILAPFVGDVDEVAVYRAALSGERIAAHFAAASPTVPPPDFYRSTVGADAPLLHWRLGDTPGAAIAEDASPNNRDGAYVGTPAYHTAGGPSELTPGITLSGDDYVDRASEAATNFERTDPFTVETWFRHGAVATSGAESLVEKMLGSPSFRGYGLAMAGTADSMSAGRLRFHLINQNDIGNRIFVRTNHRFDDSQWHHVVATYDGSSTAAGVRIYVDGTLAATTVEVNALSGTTQSAARLRAGSRTGAGDAILAPFVGDVDEVAVYPTALSGTRIAAHFDAAAMPPPSPTIPTVSNLTPADGAISATSTPTLSATFNDPTGGDDGFVEFEIYESGSLVTSNAAGPHTFVQPGQTSSWQVPGAALQSNGTYTWRARAFDGVNYSAWTSSPATRTLMTAGTYPTVAQWSADEETGRVDYDFRVSASGLNAPGEVAGPCYQIGCSWRVEARYMDGAIEKPLGTIASGDLAADTPSMSETLSGILSMEVTDIKTIVDPGSCSACSQNRTRYDSGWTRVAEPYGTGDISLAVTTWERDNASGSYAYDFSVTLGGAAQVGGPCHERPCQWTVEARYDNGFIADLGSKQYPAGTWTVSETVSGTTISGKITELSATLESMCAVTPAYWCWDPYEAYTTGWMPVSDFMAADIDVNPLVGFVASRNITLDEFCLRAEEEARRNRVPDATPHTSPHSVTEACLVATSVPNAIKLMVAVAGGTVVIGAIIISLDGDNPNQDAIAKVPSPGTDVIGSAVSLPQSCLDAAQKALLEKELHDGNWYQKHHAASDKNSFWTQVYKDLLAQYPWAADKTLGQSWNLMKDLLHRGNHPPAYHYWIYRNLEKALHEATDWDSFYALWKEWVLDVIEGDPTVVRWEWWRC